MHSVYAGQWGKGISAKAISDTIGQQGGQSARATAKKKKDLHAAGHAQPLWDLRSGCMDMDPL